MVSRKRKRSEPKKNKIQRRNPSSLSSQLLTYIEAYSCSICCCSPPPNASSFPFPSSSSSSPTASPSPSSLMSPKSPEGPPPPELGSNSSCSPPGTFESPGVGAGKGKLARLLLHLGTDSGATGPPDPGVLASSGEYDDGPCGCCRC